MSHASGRSSYGMRMTSDTGRRNLRPLSLHVPEPKLRPGDPVDFSDFEIPAAGSVGRPDIGTAPADMTGHAYTLVRVLDDEGRAVGPCDPRLEPERLIAMLRHMALTRAYDDRMYRAQRQGKPRFYMKCTGEEATAIAAAYALDREDMVFPSRSEEHTSKLQSLMRISYAVFCLKKKT